MPPAAKNIAAVRPSTAQAGGIKLTPDLLIGVGSNRACYRYPNNPAMCVKVDKRDEANAKKRDGLLGRLRHSSFLTRGQLSHNEREFRNYLAACEKAGEDFHRFTPRCHGPVDTSEGDGLAFDIVRDSNGMPSPCLADFVLENPAARRQLALTMVDDLQLFVSTNNFLFLFDFHPWHLLAQNRDGEMRLIVVDWKGKNRELIPISSWLSCFARAKIRRRFNRLREWIRNAGAEPRSPLSMRQDSPEESEA